MTGGFEWVIDAQGCAAKLASDVTIVRELLDEVVRALELEVVGTPQFHKFPGPGGITALYLLSESHLAIHTFPETGVVTLNLYCCAPRPDFDWTRFLMERLRASHVTVHKLARGR